MEDEGEWTARVRETSNSWCSARCNHSRNSNYRGVVIFFGAGGNKKGKHRVNHKQTNSVVFSSVFAVSAKPH